jgi:hypothetical protein
MPERMHLCAKTFAKQTAAFESLRLEKQEVNLKKK